MTYITNTSFFCQSDLQVPTEDLSEMQSYLDAREDAVNVMLSAKQQIFGSARLGSLLGVAARLNREISG